MSYLLDLHDGRPPIPCRDAHQADLLRGIWRAWCTGVAEQMGLRDETAYLPIDRTGEDSAGSLSRSSENW